MELERERERRPSLQTSSFHSPLDQAVTRVGLMPGWARTRSAEGVCTRVSKAMYPVWGRVYGVDRVWGLSHLLGFRGWGNSTVSEWRHENSWILISHTSGRLSDKLFTEMACGYRNALPNTCLALLLCTLNSKNIMSINCEDDCHVVE